MNRDYYSSHQNCFYQFGKLIRTAEIKTEFKHCIPEYVNIGNINAQEVDFITSKNNKTIYIQVAYILSNEETVRREFAPLLEIPDNYPKYVLSMDEEIWVMTTKAFTG